MDKLYIIGNGFDLHHKLKTSYYNFSEYLKVNDAELYETLEKFINFPKDERDLWSKFEENLANLDIGEILADNANYLPDIASDEFRDRDRHAFPDVISRIKESLTDGLLEAFKNFILEVEIPESAKEFNVELDLNAEFLNFNYTETLEQLYGLDPAKITYIHNCASKSDIIILGHGIDPAEFEVKLPEPPDDIEPEQLEEWYDRNISYDYSYDTGRDELLHFFSIMHKPTETIISENEKFFSQLSSVKIVYVFGHSMSDVDIPYFKEVKKSIQNNALWIVSYHNDSQIDYYRNRLWKLGIDDDNIDVINLTDIQLNKAQLRIDFDNLNKGS